MDPILADKVSHIINDLTPAGPKSVFFLAPTSWAKYERALKILGINTNNFSESVSFKSRSSFSRSLRKMDFLADEFRKMEMEKAKNLRTPYIRDFILGDIDYDYVNIYSVPSFIKESARLSLFLLENIFKQIDKRLELSRLTDHSDSRFSSIIGDSLKLKWLNGDIDFFYRFHPLENINGENADNCHTNFVLDRKLHGNEPITYMLSKHFDKQGTCTRFEDINYYACNFDIKGDDLILNLGANIDPDKMWSNGPRQTLDNWTCYKFTLKKKELQDISENSSPDFFRYDLGTELFEFTETEDFPGFGGMANTKLIPLVQRKEIQKDDAGPLLTEYQILDIFRKLNEKQIQFLQDLINLKKK